MIDDWFTYFQLCLEVCFKFYNIMTEELLTALQKHYAVVQALALDEDEMPEVKDETLPDEEGMARYFSVIIFCLSFLLKYFLCLELFFPFPLIIGQVLLKHSKISSFLCMGRIITKKMKLAEK